MRSPADAPRDPRVDPQPGDVVPVSKDWTRTVTKREGEWVFFDAMMDGRPCPDCLLPLSTWRWGFEKPSLQEVEDALY